MPILSHIPMRVSFNRLCNTVLNQSAMALYYLGIHFRKTSLLGHILESYLLRFPSHMKIQAQDPSVE